MNQPQHDTAQSVEFLKRWAPKGPWVITSIAPDRKAIETRTFRPKQAGQLAEWVEKFQGTRNMYFHVNPVLRDLTKKAEKGDIASLAWLHVDIDPRVGEDIEEERERALRLLKEYSPAPTVIVDSGGGYQGFWRLEEPLAIGGDVAKAEDAERYNIQLERVFSADNCHNVDRIMRLPGTINVPDAKKRKKGRQPRLASVVEFDESRVYPITKFTQAPKIQTEDVGFGGRTVEVSGNVERLDSVDDLDQWECPDWLKVLIVQGNDPDDPHKYPSRSEAYFHCTCELVRRDVPDDVIYSILTDPSFGISEAILEKRRPEKYALRQIERAHEDAIDPMLRKLNEKHAVIGDMGGKCRIISEIFDHAMKRHKISRQSFEDFRNRYRHIKVTVGFSDKGAPIEKASGAWWIDHPQRRQFETLVFAPGQEVPDAYNLWKGFSCDALPGDKHQRYLDHIRDNICKGREDLYQYLLGWMARCVQEPDSPGEVAIVLRGGRGTGKSMFAKVFGNLFGRHFLQVADPKHLVGSFNAHLRDTVVLFGDEAFYAGDKKHESVLKTLITEETLVIEGKGVDAEAAPNYTHLIMASNESWVVPAGNDERRYLVLDVGDGQKQNREYFKAMRADLDDGGMENLLHFLMTYDISEYEVRQVPTTTALQDQKLHSLQPEEQWWYEKLYYGRLLEDHDGWVEEVMTKDLQEDYVLFMQKIGIHRKVTSVGLAKFLNRVCPDSMPTVRQKRAEVSTYTPDGFLIKKQARPYFYGFPDLQTLRDLWDERYGGPYPWQPIQEVEDPENRTKEPF